MHKSAANRPSINSFEFEYISNFLENQAGIILEPGKEYLAASNLQSVCNRVGISSVKELIWQLKNNTASNDVKNKIIQSMTINETLFFRDNYPFDDLRQKVVPDIIESQGGKKSLNIWSASCSTGQEPYSLAILLKQNFPELNDWEIKFFASDIDWEAIEKAKTGKYNTMEISRGLPLKLRERFMVQDGRSHQFKENIRSMIEFKVINLIEAWPFKVKFNLVLLRNTLIYFKPETKKMIIRKIHRFMDKNGYLLLSAADIFQESEIPFRQVTIGKTTFYRPL